MLPINFNRFSFVAQTNLTIFLSFGRQMTHLSRSVGDKMLADMPEGSAADYDGDYGDNYDGEDDMSGSGEGTSCKSKMHNGSEVMSDCCFLFSSSTDGPNVIPPVVEPGSPHDDRPRIDLGETPSAGASQRISFAPTTLVLTSLIVIFVKLL